MNKTCERCKTQYQYSTQEEIEKYFYKKNTRTGTYFQRVCKECVKLEHKEKYGNGKYNYRKQQPEENNSY
jgi:hypothetical protein